MIDDEPSCSIVATRPNERSDATGGERDETFALFFAKSGPRWSLSLGMPGMDGVSCFASWPDHGFRGRC